MPFTDTFTGTNGTALTTHNANWVLGTSSGAMNIQSNAAAGAGADGFHRYNQTFAAAHYSKAKLVAIAGGAIGVSVRGQAAAKSFYYSFYIGTVFNGQCVAGTYTDWDSGVTGPANGDTFELSIDETTTTTIYYKINGVTNTTYTSKSALSGGQAGLVADSTDAGMRVDDWEGGDIGGAPASSILRQMMNYHGG